MRRLFITGIGAMALAAAPLAAQAPMGPGPGGAPLGGPGMQALGDPASFLLARTGELRLTDAQVVRLAAIARRAAERRATMRASMDSMRPAFTPGTRPDSAARSRMRAQMGERMQQMRASRDRVMEQMRTDRRDAIAVLTPDQQARAWEMLAAMPRGPRLTAGPRMRRMPMGPMRDRGRDGGPPREQ
jgi:hypothetical protein